VSLIELAIYAAIAAAVAFGAHEAWDGFKDKIGAPYAQKQQAADQVVVDSLTKRAETAEKANADSTKAAQDKAAADLAAQQKSDATIAAANKAKAALQAQIDKLAGIASGPPAPETCDNELADTNSILDAVIADRVRH
jgi:hypothetical protein